MSGLAPISEVLQVLVVMGCVVVSCIVLLKWIERHTKEASGLTGLNYSTFIKLQDSGMKMHCLKI